VKVAGLPGRPALHMLTISQRQEHEVPDLRKPVTPALKLALDWLCHAQNWVRFGFVLNVKSLPHNR